MKKLLIFALMSLTLMGCYEGKIKKAYQGLKIGANKAEVDKLFKNFKFIKEQTISAYTNHNEEDMRSSYWGDHSWEDVQPDQEQVIRSFTFDGNTKVLSYLVDTESHWPNNKTLYYVAIFYDKLNDKVLGKAVMTTTIQPHNWSERF